ncbi:pantothenate kinase [Stutzerimonas decontaminans]|jgi:type III pantothenate kinase|uniref:Type III pantothenate kinase n=1 Tax=Stutzerimonas decontaminans TaxID=3022791 RepID=A0ABX4VTG0_9GAMM|nr:type III pantothenate kinase [Stutzerimonas decontaminans]MCQ4243437.1 type III pantothenate kinase [Stutzerimonas decontaminans]MCW8159054.1 type III pantothenate kinase [Stutzerimonas stutzeri]PNF83143.1 pantothenate kinase [Stutzerimonas decontaminans]
MILELDCGNSFIKWRVLGIDTGLVAAQGASASVVDLVNEISGVVGADVIRARLVSVRGDRETDELCLRLSEVLGVDVERASPSIQLGGVINGYVDHRQLGMDRWLAMVGAFQLKRNAMMVIDLGTAVTVDLVDSQGMHLGGYISPGIALLRHQLHTHTRRISYSLEDITTSRRVTAPGRCTTEAVERGCLLMLRGFVSSQILQADEYLGAEFEIYATGGDVALINDIPRIQCIPDLVFRGLAIACP